MNIELITNGNGTELWIDNAYATTFNGKNTDYVVKWVNANISNANIHIQNLG